MHRIALADTFHLHEKNFPSLFKFMKSAKIAPSVLLTKNADNYGLIHATGDYEAVAEITSPFISKYILEHAEAFLKLDDETAFAQEVEHLRLWPLCRSELLAFLLTKDNWQQEAILKDDVKIFEKARKENPRELALNMAVAAYWVTHWHFTRKQIFSNQFCCVFSGSLTYVRTLMELLRRSPTKVYVMESLFTGTDYIFEEGYHPVANNLGVQFPNVRLSRRNPVFEEPNQFDREVIKARNKILSATNKNVVQPKEVELPKFPFDREQVLIAGQVANDFSLIEDGFPYIGSIPAYINLITKLLERTNKNIVFKAHPWEHKKIHLKSPKTFEALSAFISSLPQEYRARILLVDDVNLHALIDKSDYFVTFCSQSSIEAALFGLKPFTLGKAFYSRAGFTEDCRDIDELVAAIKEKSGTLSKTEYKNFDRFIVDLLQYGTVSTFDSGVKRIADTLRSVSPIEQKSPIKAELDLDTTDQRKPISVDLWRGVFKQKSSLSNDPDSIKALQSAITIDFEGLSETYSSTAGLVELLVRIQNGSDYSIPMSFGPRSIHISYHIWDEHGGRYVWNGEMTPLSSDIHTDAVMPMKLNVPDKPGDYRISAALISPGVCWFENKNIWTLKVE